MKSCQRFCSIEGSWPPKGHDVVKLNVAWSKFLNNPLSAFLYSEKRISLVTFPAAAAVTDAMIVPSQLTATSRSFSFLQMDAKLTDKNKFGKINLQNKILEFVGRRRGWYLPRQCSYSTDPYIPTFTYPCPYLYALMRRSIHIYLNVPRVLLT